MVDATKKLRETYRTALGSTYDVYDILPEATLNPVIVFAEMRQRWDEEGTAELSVVHVDLQVLKFASTLELKTCYDAIDTVSTYVLSKINDENLPMDFADTFYIIATKVIDTRLYTITNQSGERIMVKQLTFEHRIGEI